MKFDKLLNESAHWMDGDGPEGDIVMTSRVRLARNLTGAAFPGWAKKDERVGVLQKVQKHVEGLTQMEGAYSGRLAGLNAIEKQVLVERHLISREHAARGGGSAAVMNRNQSVSVMVNEEDHLRIQGIFPGLQLEEAYAAVDSVDQALEQHLDFAFDEQLGYLTACPTNLGTGMRASVMLHLPALVLSDRMNQVVTAANKIGLAVRGFYGEGTEALANLFQVSNQHTLGDRERDIIARLKKVIDQIISHERNARGKLLEDRRSMVMDQIGRAYAILKFAHIIPSKEVLNLLSMIRLGADLGIFPTNFRQTIDTLMMEIQPAHLQHTACKKLSAEDRDRLRAEIVRRKLKSLPDPDINSMETDSPFPDDLTLPTDDE